MKMKTHYQNVWDAAKVVLTGKLTALNIHIRKEERPKINYLSFHLRKLEKFRANNSNLHKNGIIITAEINEIENRKPKEKINEPKSWLLEKINKIDKSLARLSEK